MAGYAQNQGYGDDIGHGYHKSTLRKDEVRLPEFPQTIHSCMVFEAYVFHKEDLYEGRSVCLLREEFV